MEMDSRDQYTGRTQSSLRSSQCSAICCNSITYEAIKVSSPAILKQTQRIQGKKSRLFSADWFKTYLWLLLCCTRLRAFCSCCRYNFQMGLIKERRGGDAFIISGFDNWKKAHQCFMQHEKSLCHREAILKHQLMKQPTIQAQLNDKKQLEQKNNREMLLKQMSSLRFLLRQGLALRGHYEKEGNLVQLMTLRTEDCTNLKHWLTNNKYISHEILAELESLMAKSVLREILNEIREASFYALLADEATDITSIQQLCVNIRWVDKDLVIHEAPVEMIHAPKTDALTLTSLIKDCLVRYTLPISLCRGQAYEFAYNNYKYKMNSQHGHANN